MTKPMTIRELYLIAKDRVWTWLLNKGWFREVRLGYNDGKLISVEGIR